MNAEVRQLPLYRTVLSTTRFPETVQLAAIDRQPRYVSQLNFAEFFAELCAVEAPITPIAPLYSVENTCTPSVSIRLLTEGL